MSPEGLFDPPDDHKAIQPESRPAPYSEFEPMSALGLFDGLDDYVVVRLDPQPAPFFAPEPEPEPEPEPGPDPALLSSFDPDSKWSAAPEVFVGPRS